MQRADSLEKTLMLGKIESKWRRGQQRMRCLDGITDFNGHEFEQSPGDTERQGSLGCCSPWGCSQTRLSGWTRVGLPWWLSGEESICRCRSCGFNPWSRKIQHAVEIYSFCCKWHYFILFNDWVLFHCIYYHICFIHSSVDGHLRCFHVLAIVNSATMNTEVHVSFGAMFFSTFLHRSGIAGSYGSSVVNFLRKLHTLLPSGYTNVHPRPFCGHWAASHLF